MILKAASVSAFKGRCGLREVGSLFARFPGRPRPLGLAEVGKAVARPPRRAAPWAVPCKYT